MINEELKSVSINAELYYEWREYCDEMGIRFKGFVEDSLENAKYQEEQGYLFEETKKMLKEIEKEREKAYRRGFKEGFCAAFHIAQGKLGVGLHDNALERVGKENPFKTVGPQLELF